MIQAPIGQTILPTNQTNAEIFLELAETVGQDIPAQRLYEFKQLHRPEGNPRFWGIVDFNQHSAKKRFYIFDTKEKTVKRYFVAHGNGSDINHDGMAENFSNVSGSNCSSLGIYKCKETYNGSHGLSLKMDGLEASNSNVRSRYIVIHKADYVSQNFINQNQGVLGRSEGCFAVENSVSETLINQLKNGSYIIAWKSGF